MTTVFRRPRRRDKDGCWMLQHTLIILVGLGLILVSVFSQLFNNILTARDVSRQVDNANRQGTRTDGIPETTSKDGSAVQQSLLRHSSSSQTNMAPKNLETNDDLAVLMFTHLKTTERFDNLIFPALDSWWANETEPLYIVMTPQWKDAYREMCKEKADYCRRIHPLWVACTEAQFGESACCKQEKGLLALPKSYDWIVFADDDMYFKIFAIRQYLQRLKAKPDDVFIITAGGVSAKQLGQFGYLGRRASYKCSELPDYRYPWGQPVVYSKASLQLIRSGLQAGGLVKQCKEFNVTHDAGNSIFHWMYGLPDYAFKFHMFPGTRVSKEYFGVHGIHRYDKGFGGIVTMNDVHQQIYNGTSKKLIAFQKYMKDRHHRAGFLQSETYAKYGDPTTWGDEWHTMPVRDCMDKEMREKLG